MAEQFPTTRSLSGSVPRITRAQKLVSSSLPPDPAAADAATAPAPEDDSTVTAAAKSIGSSALSGLSMLGNLLDLPGSMVRDVLVADNPFDQLLDPLSHQSTGRSADGREVLSRNILTSWLFSKNKETGISGWADDPMEGVQDVAGFAAELALDPLSWLSGGISKVPGAFGDLAKVISTPARAGKLGKLDKGLQIINELDPGTHVGRALGIPQALVKRNAVAAAATAGDAATAATKPADDISDIINSPDTMADKAFQVLDRHAAAFQAKAKSAVQSAYSAAPQPVKSTADFIRTEAGQKVDALTRWTMSAFNNRVDGRMTETGQQSAKVMTAIQDDLTRQFSEPVIQTLSDISHYGPDGTADIKAALREGQTIEDWHSEFSESLVHALETGETESLTRMLPDIPEKENPFIQSYERLKSTGDRILHEQRASGVVVGDLSDVIDHAFRQMNPRLAEWRKNRELMPGGGEGSGVMTREDLFRGFWNGTGGKVAAGANRVTSDPEVLAAVRAVGSGKDPSPASAGKAVAKVIEKKFAGDVDPRMPVTTPSGELQFRDPSKAIGPAPSSGPLPTTPVTPSPAITPSPAAADPAVPATPAAYSGEHEAIVDHIMSFAKKLADDTGKAKINDVRAAMDKFGFPPEVVDAALFEGRQNSRLHLQRADLHFGDPTLIDPALTDPLTGNGFHYIAPVAPAPAKPAKISRKAAKNAQPAPASPAASSAPAPASPAATQEAPLFNLTRGELSSYYRRVPETAERTFSTELNDAFDLPMGERFDMQNPLHRAEVFRQKMPLKYEKIAGDPADPRFKDLPDIIHQEFEDRWEKLGHYLWGSEKGENIQQMLDHTNAIESNGGVFGRHALLNQQRYNQMAAKKIATARHFSDVFEAGLKTGQIRNPDALTTEALAQTVGRNIERSAGVRLGEVFDALEGTFDRERIYQNSYDRLAKADPATFERFMKDAELPEGLEDIADDLSDTELPKELDVKAFREHMDNLVVDQDLARELKGLHHASESPAVGMKMLKTVMATLGAQWKAGVLSFPSTQVRNYVSGAIANMYSGIWSGLSQSTAEDVLFNRANDLLQEMPEVVAYMQKRKLDPSDPLSFTRAAREMYAIEKGHLASESRDFVGQTNSADDMTDLNHMLGLLPGHQGIRSRKELGKEYLATLAGKREASWKNPFDIAGTTRFLGPNKGKIRRESNFAPVSAINIWGKASDDANRLTGWIEGMRQGKSSREAFRRSDEVQLNYDPSKFTDFEQKLKAIFPFYSFFSRQTAYFAKEIMTNPAGKLGKLIRVMNASQTDDYLPEHIRESVAIPLRSSEDGTENYITGFGLMFEDVPEVIAPKSTRDLARSIMSRSNPLLKGVGEYALGRSSFQGGPLGGRDLQDMDPVLGRIFTRLGLQDERPGGQAAPAFGSPGLEFLLSNSPVSRILSTTKTALDDRKNVIERAVNILTGMRITSVSPEQKQRGIREITNAISKDLGARPFTTFHISDELLENAKESDPEKYQTLLRIKEMRKKWDAAQRIKRRENAKETIN